MTIPKEGNNVVRLKQRGPKMTICLNPTAAVIDAEDNIVRVGDEVYMVGLGHFATVVRIIGGFHSSNVEVEYSSGFRETAFGADIVKVA